MKTIKSYPIQRITLATLVLFAGIFIHSKVSGQLKSAFYKDNGISQINSKNAQAVPNSVVLSSSFQDDLVNSDVSELKQNEGLIQNGMKLDSMVEYDFYGWQSKRFKTYFDYENGAVKTKRCIHFGKSYSDSLGVSEEWTYNNFQQIEKYKQFEKLVNWHDTIIVAQEIKYDYQGDTLIVKTTTDLQHFFYTDANYSGVKYNMGDILYNTYQERYTYNEKGQLKEYEGGEWNVNHEFYEYNDQGHLIYLFRFPYYVENYKYRYTERSIDVTYRFYPFTDEVLPFDSITDWIEYTHWNFEFDQYGRDSSCISKSIDNSASASVFEYNPNGDLSYISISFRDEVDTTKWLEQGRLHYNYNSNNLIESFLQTFYDEHWNHWETQNSKDYYYSAMKSTEHLPEPEPCSTSEDLCIYPNPVSAYLKINGLTSLQANYQIYDLNGHLMLSGNLLNPVIDVTGLTQGIYLFKLLNGNSTSVKRFVKQ